MNEKKISGVTSVAYILVSLFLLFTLTVCSKTTSHEVTIDGFAGPITIKISVADGKITGGEILAISEEAFAISAANTIIEQAIQNGNANNLDVIAGSTITSNATIEAIVAALGSANSISYEETVYASPDPITIKVSIFNGKITGGEIISASESALAFPAVTAILAQAVENGNADNLDMVSGASASSKSTIETLQTLMASTGSLSYEKEFYASPDPIMVRVTINNGKFTGGEIISASESALAFPAVTAILAQAVENGNADNLDMVSGATASSTAAIETLQVLMASTGGK